MLKQITWNLLQNYNQLVHAYFINTNTHSEFWEVWVVEHIYQWGAREFSRPRPLKPLPHHSTTKKNRKQRTQDFTPGSIPPQHLQLFIHRLSWVVVYLSSTCLTINYLYFLFRYALLYFPIHSSVQFGLFLICDLFLVCFICALSHLLTEHVEISALWARNSLQ